MILLTLLLQYPHFDWLDNVYIHAPFTISFAGWLLWTLVQWGWTRSDYINKKETFWHEYKDEAVVSFIAMLMVLIWDTQMLHAIDFAIEYVSGREVDIPSSLTPEWYMVIAPASERLYTWGGWINKKFKEKKNGAV